jgi:RNA polymerase sigma-70 factor (ECF subfamily)
MLPAENHFSEIHKAFQPRIQSYLSRMVGEHEAEDLTQEVLVKISRSLKDFRGDSQLSTWIYRVAANTALDRLRQKNNPGDLTNQLTEKMAGTGEEETDLWTGEEHPSLDQQIIRQEMNGCIRQIIDTLPADYRTVIVLSELEGLSDREVAEVLGITLQTVKIRLHRARAKLKKELSSSCVFYRDERNEFACDRKNLQVRIEKISGQ